MRSTFLKAGLSGIFFLLCLSSLAQINMTEYLGADDINARKFSFEYSDATTTLEKEFNPDDIGAITILAYEQVQREEYDSALTNINEALLAFPDYAFAHWLRGVCHMGIDSLATAEEDFNNCLSHDPLFAEAYVNLAILDIGHESYANALSKLDKASTISPESPYPYYLIGNIHLYQENERKAIRYYDKALDLDPALSMAHFSKGIIYYYERKYNKAIDALTESLTTMKDPSTVLLLRGVSHWLSGNKELALADWTEAKVYDQQNYLLDFFLGLTYLDLNQEEAGLNSLIEGVKKDTTEQRFHAKKTQLYYELKSGLLQFDIDKESLSDEVSFLAGQAIIYYIKNDYSKALVLLDEALALDPNIASILYFKALANLRLGNVDLAVDGLKQTLITEPKVFQAYLILSRIYEMQSAIMKSLLNLGDMIKAFPNESLPYLYRGDLWLKVENKAFALNDFSEVIANDSTSVIALREKGKLLLEQKQYVEVRGLMASAHNAHPFNADLVNLYGAGLYYTGDTIACIALYTNFLKEVPESSLILEARANVYFTQEEWQLAYQDYSYLVENVFNSSWKFNYLRKIDCYLALGLTQLALDACLKEMEPSWLKSKEYYSELYIRAIKCYLLFDDKNNACKTLKRGKRLGLTFDESLVNEICSND